MLKTLRLFMFVLSTFTKVKASCFTTVKKKELKIIIAKERPLYEIRH